MAKFSSDCVELVKEFEGFESRAYPDPGTGGEPFTIGYGRAHGVSPWDTCTQEQAEAWLRDDLVWADQAVTDYVRADLWQSAHDALTSFAYNVGAGALAESTLCRRLNAGEPVMKVIEEELPRWVNGGNGKMAGLVRRRDAEVELARKGQPKEKVKSTPARAISLVDAAEYFKGYEHQVEAFDYLEDLLTPSELSEFARLYRQNNENSDGLLDVRYYYQLDSETPEGFRMCFSSTNGMLVEWEEPGTLSSVNGDDEYLARVSRYGDTTDAQAQVRALESYGIDCEFITTGTWELIEDQISKGHPVPVGWLHKGNVSAPTGGGHWSLVVGIEGDSLVVHDPFGEASLVGGGYVSTAPTAGMFVRYSKKNFGPRWMVEGPGTGWMIRVF